MCTHEWDKKAKDYVIKSNCKDCIVFIRKACKGKKQKPVQLRLF